MTDQAGAGLVLKVGFRFPGGEERDKAAGLRLWDGNGAVRLHAAHESESAYALLIERCLPGTPLGQALPEPEQDQVVTGLLRQLWAQPHPGLPVPPARADVRRLRQRVRAGVRGRRARGPDDPGLARAGIALFRALPQTTGREVLLCTDLHGDNILAAQRAPWLVIDPKPYVGDPAYDVLQHMLNCENRLASDPGRAGHPDGGTGRAGRRPGPAMAVRPQRAGVHRLAAHAPGGRAARARLGAGIALTPYRGTAASLRDMAGLTIGKLATEAGVGVETVRFYQRRGLLARPERAGVRVP